MIKTVAGTRFKYAEGAASVAAIAFATEKDEETIRRAFQGLWRREQRTWVIPIDQPVTIDKALMDWVRKTVA